MEETFEDHAKDCQACDEATSVLDMCPLGRRIDKQTLALEEELYAARDKEELKELDSM